MPIRLAIFIIVHAAALIYFLESLRRISQRSKEYPLMESAETLPFGFVRLKHVVIAYVSFYILWVAASFWLYFGWLDAGAMPGLSEPPQDTDLNI